MGFVFCPSVSILGYVPHIYFLIVVITLNTHKELCFVCIICALCVTIGNFHNIQGKTPPMHKLDSQIFVPKTLVCEANERLEYLMLSLPH